MFKQAFVATLFVTAMVTVVYAATIDQPGSVSFISNSDSKVQSSTGGAAPLFLQTGNEGFLGTIAANGDISFDQVDIVFDAYTDGSGYTGQLQATASATGTFCPNSGAATITMSARIRVTEVSGGSISSTPCFVVLRNSGNTSNTFTLTTGTSGSYTGTDFTRAHQLLSLRCISRPLRERVPPATRPRWTDTTKPVRQVFSFCPGRH